MEIEKEMKIVQNRRKTLQFQSKFFTKIWKKSIINIENCFEIIQKIVQNLKKNG